MRRRDFILVTTCSVVACRCASSTPAMDGDASVVDAMDAPDAEDANTETSVDSGVPYDAVAEAGADPPFLGDWKALPGAPECGAIVSVEPAIAAPAFNWIPCPSGRSGCRLLSVDWPTRPGPPFFIPPRAALVRSAKTYLLHERWLAKVPDDGNDRHLIAVQPFDSAAEMAVRVDIRLPEHCSFAPSLGAYGFGAAGQALGKSFLVASPWPSLSPSAISFDLAKTGTPASKGIQRTITGAADLFLEAFDPNGIGVFHFPTGPVLPRKASAEYPIAVVGGAFAVNFAPSGVTFVRTDGTWTLVRSPESGRMVTWVAADRTNGDAPIWVESTLDSTGLYTSPTLWMSAYAADASTLKPRKVAALKDDTGAGGSGMVANAGMALTITSSISGTLTRLSDGAGWVVGAEPGQSVTEAIWVDDTELVIGVKPSDRPGPATSLLRLRRDTLGGPTIPAGI